MGADESPSGEDPGRELGADESSLPSFFRTPANVSGFGNNSVVFFVPWGRADFLALGASRLSPESGEVGKSSGTPSLEVLREATPRSIEERRRRRTRRPMIWEGDSCRTLSRRFLEPAMITIINYSGRY